MSSVAMFSSSGGGCFEMSRPQETDLVVNAEYIQMLAEQLKKSHSDKGIFEDKQTFLNSEASYEEYVQENKVLQAFIALCEFAHADTVFSSPGLSSSQLKRNAAIIQACREIQSTRADEEYDGTCCSLCAKVAAIAMIWKSNLETATS